MSTLLRCLGLSCVLIIVLFSCSKEKEELNSIPEFLQGEYIQIREFEDDPKEKLVIKPSDIIIETFEKNDTSKLSLEIGNVVKDKNEYILWIGNTTPPEKVYSIIFDKGILLFYNVHSVKDRRGDWQAKYFLKGRYTSINNFK